MNRSVLRQTQDLLTAGFVLAICAALNRIAGGGLPYVTELPGRAMLYAAAGMFGVTSAYLSLWLRHWAGFAVPLWVATSYALWRAFEWGTVFDLGRLPDEAPRSPFGQIFFITGSDYADLWLRMIVGLIPGTLLGAALMHHQLLYLTPRLLILMWWALGSGIWLSYVAAWKLQEFLVIPLAELITGGVWGVAVLSIPALWKRAS